MKNRSMNAGRKKFLIPTVLGILFWVCLGIRADAGTNENTTGWLWGGGDNGSGINSGVGWISVNNLSGGGSVSYGINIPTGNNNLSGSAYGENMGYIVFDNSAGLLNGCPDGDCRAYRSGTDIRGWARFSDIAQGGANAGGNVGWIHLSGAAQNGSTYGVKIGANGQMNGYGWSDEFGYISFARVTANIPSYSCIGTIPSSAVMFPNDDVGLDIDTPYTYNDTDTGTRCQYHCFAGYGWDTVSSTCKQSINGQCGSAQGGSVDTIPTANLCSVGTSSGVYVNSAHVYGTADWAWNCSGLYGGNYASCGAECAFDCKPHLHCDVETSWRVKNACGKTVDCNMTGTRTGCNLNFTEVQPSL